MPISKDEHIVKRYDQELANLRNLVLEMGGLVEEQIKRAMQALEDQDVASAREVIARDQLVNGLEIKIDEASTSLVALRQPLASDLRLIMSMHKAVTDLERIGDEAERIARMVVHLYDTAASPPSNQLFRDVEAMAALATNMLHTALDALARLDEQKAVQIVQSDHQLDDQFQDGLRRLITYMMADPRIVGDAINILFMLRSLERIGDHAKNIGEYVVYLVKGKDIRHAALSHTDAGEPTKVSELPKPKTTSSDG
jgi:phosphate transport system protein